MTPRLTALAALALLWIAAVLPLGAQTSAPGRNITYINGIPDTSSYFLDDTTVLARVNARPITVQEFIETYYNSYAEDRPRSDSTGRAEWLNSMVNKEILGAVARRADYPFGFEERVVMRDHTQRALSNVLYQRAVVDSIDVPESEIRSRYERLKTEYHLRRIRLPDRAIAERLRGDLVAKRIAWKDAVAKYSTARNDSGPGGDLGWLGQAVESDDMRIFGLSDGQISPVIEDPTGFLIVQLLARRKVEPIAIEGARPLIRAKLAQRQADERQARLLGILRARSGMQYDTANIRWASSRFPAGKSRNPEGLIVRLRTRVPVVTPSDTGRVLARWRDGRLSLSEFLRVYSNLSPIQRPDVSDPKIFARQVDEIVLEPYKARMAVERGLDQDPLAVSLIEKKREQLLVEHLYRDSVEARVFVPPALRRKYYEAHLAQFMTYASVRYALLARTDSSSIQALVARLKKGERAEDIQRADSLAGLPSKMRVEHEDGNGVYHGLLFQELKPGMREVLGPDEKGQYVVVQSLGFDPGRQLSFAESDRYADENMRAEMSEDLLKQLIARHRREFRIESHPELVMRVKLMDPATRELAQ